MVSGDRLKPMCRGSDLRWEDTMLEDTLLGIVWDIVLLKSDYRFLLEL